MIAAVVSQVSPLLITIPSVTGKGTVPAVLVQPAVPPALGEAVWADQVTGLSAWLVVNVPVGSGPAGAGWSSGAGVPSGAPANNQVFYLRTSTGDVYQWVGSSWSIVANLKGANGSAGATGPAGPTGPTGPSGSNGTNGTNGAAGATGPTGATGNGWSSGTAVPSAAPANNQVYYHHTTTGDIYTWSGSAWSVTGNIKGPQGATGAAGTNGTNGTNGATGPQGPVGPTGSVMSYAGSSNPGGWLVCDGSAVSRTTYAALFAVVGTTYGAGDGSTTFNLPNLQGRVVVGFNGSDSDFNIVGKTGGAKNPSHNHALSDAGQAQMFVTTAGYVSTRRIASPSWTESLNWTATRTSGSATTQTQGAGLMGATDAAAPSALQPFIAMLMIIKT